MFDDIFAIILAGLKALLGIKKSPPEVTELKKDIQDIRNEAIERQKPPPSVDTGIDSLRSK